MHKGFLLKVTRPAVVIILQLLNLRGVGVVLYCMIKIFKGGRGGEWGGGSSERCLKWGGGGGGGGH